MPDELEDAALPLLEEMDKATEGGSGQEMKVCDWHNHMFQPQTCRMSLSWASTRSCSHVAQDWPFCSLLMKQNVQMKLEKSCKGVNLLMFFIKAMKLYYQQPN